MQLPITHISVPYTDLKPLIYTHIHSESQQEWDSQPNNKLHQINPNVHRIPPLSSQLFSLRDEVVDNRLRIGYSCPTHSYLLHKDPQPPCIPCHSPFSQNILTEY